MVVEARVSILLIVPFWRAGILSPPPPSFFSSRDSRSFPCFAGISSLFHRVYFSSLASWNSTWYVGRPTAQRSPGRVFLTGYQGRRLSLAAFLSTNFRFPLSSLRIFCEGRGCHPSSAPLGAIADYFLLFDQELCRFVLSVSDLF